MVIAKIEYFLFRSWWATKIMFELGSDAYKLGCIRSIMKLSLKTVPRIHMSWQWMEISFGFALVVSIHAAQPMLAVEVLNSLEFVSRGQWGVVPL